MSEPLPDDADFRQLMEDQERRVSETLEAIKLIAVDTGFIEKERFNEVVLLTGVRTERN